MATHSCHLCSLSFKHTPECTKQREYEGKLVYVCDPHAREGLDAKLSRAPADFGPAPSVRSYTSELAARSMDRSVNYQCETILKAIREAGSRGLIREEVCKLTGVTNQASCARLNELERKGLVRKSASYTRKATTKRQQQIYIFVEQGSIAA